MNEMKEERRAMKTLALTVSAFPLNLFQQWDVDCKENFGDCRWMKMWSDHKTASEAGMNLELLRAAFEEMEHIKKRLDALEGKQKTIDEPVTLGGGKAESRKKEEK